MATNPLLQQIAELKQSLVEEGIMNDQFVQLDSKPLDKVPNFTEESIKFFYAEAKEKIEDLEELTKKILTDYAKMDKHLVKLIDLCAKVGACKAKGKAIAAKEFCDQKDIVGLKFALDRVKTAIETFKDRISGYIQLMNQANDTK